MKWQMILPLVALFALALVPSPALAHHHHHCWGGYGNGAYGGGYNPWQAQRMMQGYGGGYNAYNMGVNPYRSSYGYGNGFGGYGNGYGGYGNTMLSGFGRIIRGF